MEIRKNRHWPIVIAALVALMGLGALGSVLWYRQMLEPVNVDSQTTVRIDIKEGSSLDAITSQLEEKQLIKNSFAFSVYVRLHGVGGKFQSGVYSVKPSQNVAEIVSHLTSGKSDEISITFYPGATLDTKAKNSDGREVASVLKKAGFSDGDIRRAFTTAYDSPIFSGRPDGAGLEGYIFGETFYISPDEKAEQVVQRSLNQFEKIAKQYDLEAKFRARGLTLYQGITLASVVQKESIGCGAGATSCDDMRQIASVFYNRMKKNMVLGSDVTYQYAADKTGATRTPTLDSPYNTRIHQGLPPGPIAVPSVAALNAVANPAETGYLYFLSGDDDKTYFGTTNEEHDRNIKDHCKEKCLIS